MLRPIPEEILVRARDSGVSFDCHCHLINKDTVPNGYLGVRLPFTKRFLSFAAGLVRWFGKMVDKEKITNLSYFLKIFKKSEKEILKKLISYYPANTIFCPLLINMDPSIKGRVRVPYPDQVRRIESLCKEFNGRLWPFFGLNPLDPHMPGQFGQVMRWAGCFAGIKVYPPMGYLPSHPRLMSVYEECELTGMPVTTHCSFATVHTTKHHLKNIEGTEIQAGHHQKRTTTSGWFWSKKDYSWFSHPKKWEPVLEAYPKLTLNLGHFGGNEEWRKFVDGKDNAWVTRIIDMMHRYPNVYADISYTLFDRRVYAVMKDLLENNEVVRNRTLYGSDYYMVVLDGHFRHTKRGFEVAMGDDIMRQISIVNPRRFLFGTENP